MGVTASLPMYVIEDVPGKGKGVIATKDIPKGTRIICEEPIITQVSSLNEDQIREFLSMENVYPYTHSAERWTGIFRTNSLPVGPDLDAGGVFLKACRINHACDHNAQNFWNDNLNQLTIHAVRDIRKGEEITIYYLSSCRNRQTRQEELRQNFKFTCSCRLCSLPAHQSRESDSRLNRIHVYDCIIELGGVQGLIVSPRRMLRYVDEQVQLWNDPTPDEVGLSRAYPDAFQLAIANGDLARARIFAERLIPLYLTTMGADSPDVIQYTKLALDPSTHEYYGMSMEWKTTLDGVPQGLGLKEFEDWLWKR